MLPNRTSTIALSFSSNLTFALRAGPLLLVLLHGCDDFTCADYATCPIEFDASNIMTSNPLDAGVTIGNTLRTNAAPSYTSSGLTIDAGGAVAEDASLDGSESGERGSAIGAIPWDSSTSGVTEDLGGGKTRSSSRGSTSAEAGDHQLAEPMDAGNGADSSCAEGVCNECDPSSREFRCDNGNSEVCDAAGKWVINQECGDAAPACIPNTGRCGLCSESESVCVNETMLGVCNAAGTFLQQECEFACVGDQCSGECVPKSLRCRSQYAPEQCDDEGQWARLSECPDDQACDTETGKCIAPPIVARFDADAVSAHSGDEVVLSWDVSGADYAVISPIGGLVSGTSVTVAPTQTTVYTLTAGNEAGQVTASVRVAIVSRGEVASIRHYGTTGSGGVDILVDAINERLVVVDGSSDPYVTEHSQENGALLGEVALDNVQLPTAIAQTQTGFIVVGARNAYSLLDNDFREVESGAFEVSIQALESLTDVLVKPDGTAVAIGWSPDDHDYFAEISNDGEDILVHATEAVQSTSLALDSDGRMFKGGNATLGRFSVENWNEPSRSATLQGNGFIQVALDQSGNAFALGANLNDGQSFIAKFSNDLGEPIWHNAVSDSPAPWLGAIAIDAAGNAIVAGAIGDDYENTDVLVEAYRSDGSKLWERIVVVSPGDATALGVVADDRGNVFVVGRSEGPLAGSTGYFENEEAFIMQIE